MKPGCRGGFLNKFLERRFAAVDCGAEANEPYDINISPGLNPEMVAHQ